MCKLPTSFSRTSYCALKLKFALPNHQHFPHRIQRTRKPRDVSDISSTLTRIGQRTGTYCARSATQCRSQFADTLARSTLGNSYSMVRLMRASEYANLLPNGFRYEIHKTVTATDLYLWARLTGEPYNLQRTLALRHQAAARRCVVPGAYLTDLSMTAVSRLAAHVPAPGAVLTTLTVHFTRPVLVGTSLCVTVTITDSDSQTEMYWLDLCVTGADGKTVLRGKAALQQHRAWLPA
jgi:acyl dehydratase